MKYFLIFLPILFFACQTEITDNTSNPYEKIEDEAARILLQKAIERAGGIEKWESKKSIAFQKYVALYDSAGNTEQANWQQHLYTYQPNSKIEIAWKKDSQVYKIEADDTSMRRLIDGQKDTTANAQSLENSVLSATFVISLPFKLLDEGVRLSHIGTRMIENGLEVEVLKAVYNAEQHNNHSNQDVWELYFDTQGYKMIGYQVQHDDHISYVLNESFVTVDGLLFPHLRKSYRMNEAGEKLFLRAAYEYKGYELK